MAERDPGSPSRLRELGQLLIDYWIWWVLPVAIVLALLAVLALGTFGADSTFNYSPF